MQSCDAPLLRQNVDPLLKVGMEPGQHLALSRRECLSMNAIIRMIQVIEPPAHEFGRDIGYRHISLVCPLLVEIREQL